jgi:hypothetical protein
VDILLELAKHGVQIFLASHDYHLMKYFGIKKRDASQVYFHGFYKTDDGSVQCDTKTDYQLLNETMQNYRFHSCALRLPSIVQVYPTIHETRIRIGDVP